MRKIIPLAALLVISALVISCSAENGKSKGKSGGPLRVAVSILPQKYFIERIAGPLVAVDVLVAPGKSPSNYEPTPDQVTALGKASIFFSIGVAFERTFLPKISANLKELKIVDTSQGIDKRDLAPGTPDPHIWMSPKLVMHQAAIIRDNLAELDPKNRQAYLKGYNEFVADLDALNSELAQILKPYQGKILFVFHPAFGYLADDYGLVQRAIETGGKEPTPAHLAAIIGEAKRNGIRIIFVQPEFPQESARAVAQGINGAVVNLNPLNPDYLGNLRHMAREISKGLK